MSVALDITPEQQQTLGTVLHQYLPNVAVWAYGSRVKQCAHRYSDLDLVVFASPAQYSQVAELREALAESNLPFPVDVLIWDELPASFHHNIQARYTVVQKGAGR